MATCLSVTLMYCAQTTESIMMRPSPDCSPAILVFAHQVWEYTSFMASNGRGIGKSRKIRPINRNHSPVGSSCQHGKRRAVCQRTVIIVTLTLFIEYLLRCCWMTFQSRVCPALLQTNGVLVAVFHSSSLDWAVDTTDRGSSSGLMRSKVGVQPDSRRTCLSTDVLG